MKIFSDGSSNAAQPTISFVCEVKRKQEKLFHSLDPVALLTDLEILQTAFWSTAVAVQESASHRMLKRFIRANAPLASEKREVAPTLKRARRSKVWMPTAPYPSNKKGKRTNLDDVWDEVCCELTVNPEMTPREVLRFLDLRHPNKCRQSQITTITDKLRRWRYEHSLPIEFARSKPGKETNIEVVWQLAQGVLTEQPNVSANGLVRILIERYPEQAHKGQRTSIFARP